MIWKGDAPSNIALIKYMGKTDASVNRPTNGSISLSLDHLRTYVELESSTDSDDSWKALAGEGLQLVELSDKGRTRFLKHFQFLKQTLGISGHYQIRSANNFPSDCGLASSASSFAALTLATYKLAEDQFGADLPLHKVAELSRQGSGSSCRSFFSPWCEWKDESVEPVEGLPSGLLHTVVVVDDSQKTVSSSAAHKAVLTSTLFEGRVERAEERLSQLKSALKDMKWEQAYQLCWAEFWDMHALFETSKPHFGYMTGGSLDVLNTVREHWSKNADGPLITMDAGANVHLIYRDDQQAEAQELATIFKNKKYSIHSNF